jgi:hypothetical protein
VNWIVRPYARRNSPARIAILVAVDPDPRIGKNKLVKILNDHQIMPHIVQDRIVDVPPIVRNIRTAVIGLWERRNTPALTGSEVVEA